MDCQYQMRERQTDKKRERDKKKFMWYIFCSPSFSTSAIPPSPVHIHSFYRTSSSYPQDGLNSHGGKDISIVADDLWSQRGNNAIFQSFFIIKTDWLLNVIEDSEGLIESDLETFRDSGGVNTLLQQQFTGTQQSTSNNTDWSSTVASFNILGPGNFDKLFIKSKIKVHFRCVAHDETSHPHLRVLKPRTSTPTLRIGQLWDL